ncbi:hypothetical protein [Tenacibaculum aiptasiae]|uniref:hypothetical protein n=1 Tax=Tenacibaculum aiptasiae TaxID=426481 RepID=UPI00232BC26F|nr:hypothetical protein [Tenacibaculum aiptasiae]
MKKVLVLLAFFCTIFLTSCTDESEENLQNETKQLVNHNEIGDDDEDQQEGGD